jgi:ATP-dependent exoDNAse (exonuclease V) beta subunit
MEREQKFDFTALEDRALELIRSHRERYESRFDVVMVDEAQDLNPKQHQLLQILGSRRTLTVGDDRQAIYGFRLADPELFRAQYQRGALRLTKNYRSADGILDFIDHVFGSFWKEDYDPGKPPVPFDLEEVSKPEFDGVEIWEMGRDGVQKCATNVLELVQEGVLAQDICVLTRNGKTCQVIQEALGSVGLKGRVFGGSERFYTRMEVRDLANILRCLADPYDDFSLLATLRGPAVGLTMPAMFRLALCRPVLEKMDGVALDDEDAARLETFLIWFDPLRRYADRLSAWEVVSKVFAQTPFLRVLGERAGGLQQIANVRKLLSLAARDTHLGPVEFANRIRDIQALRHKEADADEYSDPSQAVQLMTIHKAKGLEFPVVVLPETRGKLGVSQDEIVFDPELRMVSAKFDSGASLFHKYLSYRKHEREVAEELRVLYVGMTRARERLCVGLYPPSQPDSLSKRVRNAIKGLELHTRS